MRFEKLETSRLLLVPLAEEHGSALFPIFGDQEVMQYWSRPPISSLKEMKEYMRWNIAQAPDKGRTFCLFKKDGYRNGIGWVSLYGAEHGIVSMGYILAKSCWGQGYAKEAIIAVLDHAFFEWGMHRVWLDTDPRNKASIGMAERLGFKTEGILRDHFHMEGRYYDSQVLGLLAKEWCEIRKDMF